MNRINPHNNFDLIRLLAAIQVFVGHVFLFKFFHENWLSDVIWFIPGVPVFFGMSGFLLLWSLERNADLLSYFKNRLLRLFPALWATMALTALTLLAFHTISLHDLFTPSCLMYLVGRCTIIFYFVPAVVKGFAQGNPNGSLWTIGVELQFYLLLPLIYLLIRRHSLLVKNLVLIAIGAISYWIDRHDPSPPFDVAHMNGYLQILVSEIRIFYYLFFFVVGMLFFVNYDLLRKALVGRFRLHLGIYVMICAVSYVWGDISSVDRYSPDLLSLLRHIYLMVMVFSGAFTNSGLSERLLKGNDYSYGVYLTHLLVLNAFYELGRFSNTWNVLLAALVTALLAWLSWHGIEKRALRLKKYSLRARLRADSAIALAVGKITIKKH